MRPVAPFCARRNPRGWLAGRGLAGPNGAKTTMDQASCGSPKELGAPLSAMAASHRRPRPLTTGAHLPIKAVEAVEPMLTCQWKSMGGRASVRFRMLVILRMCSR